MEEAIDYEGVVKGLILENEQLKERIAKLAFHKNYSFDKIVAAWQAMEWQSRYFAVVITCAILLAISRIIRDVRGV